MGLDFSSRYTGNSAYWSYSGFHRFRCNLAKEIGINLDEMNGFGLFGNSNKIVKSWDQYKDDPITLLLNHSDCDGELSSEDCGKIFPRLQELISSWNSQEFDYQQAQLLIAEMKWCYENQSTLEFC